MSDESKNERAQAGLRAEAGGRAETEGVSQREHPGREARPQGEKERFRDFFSRLQNRGSDLDTGERSDWSGTSWSGNFGGRKWSGGRER